MNEPTRRPWHIRLDDRMMPMQQMMEERPRKRQECVQLFFYLCPPFDPGKNYSPADAKAKDFEC